MAFWAYIIRCATGRYYTGQTDTLDRRIAEHQAGGFCDFTARRQPVRLVWSDTFHTWIEALEAERRLKGSTRARKEALIAGDRDRLHELAISREARASTSLSTNGGERTSSHPFVLSEVEARVTDTAPTP